MTHRVPALISPVRFVKGIGTFQVGLITGVDTCGGHRLGMVLLACTVDVDVECKLSSIMEFKVMEFKLMEFRLMEFKIMELNWDWSYICSSMKGCRKTTNNFCDACFPDDYRTLPI